MRRMLLLTGAIIVTVLLATAGAASAAIRNPDGQMAGPSSFEASDCDGSVSYLGTGMFAGREFGIGTYTFDVCLSTVAPGFTFTGTIKFTFRSGAKLRGTINTHIDAPPVQFLVDVTGGTKRFAKARGTLVLGPFTQSECTRQEHLICTAWTDTGHIGGTLIRVRLPSQQR
jgi:hypothetical protein